MNPVPQFLVYNASAGSGKTYTLTKEYLRLCLRTNDAKQFREILAITFTNKAAAEMKLRVLSALKAIADNTQEDQNLIDTLCAEIEIDHKTLKFRAQKVHQQILHNYADFSISTIDHFTHRLIRTFAADLRLSPTFDVELDQDRLLTEATDLLVSKAGTDPQLTSALSNYVEERIVDERSWNLEDAIKETAQHLYKEKSRVYVQQLKKMPLNQYFKVKKELSEKYYGIKTEMQKIAKDAIHLIDSHNINHAVFAGTAKISKYFVYVSNWHIEKFIPSNQVITNLEKGAWVTAKEKQHEAAVLEIAPQLSDAFYTLKNLAEQNLPFLLLSKEVLKEFYAMAVLDQVNLCLEEIKEQENVMAISEFNPLIFDELKKQPVPYIYERLGERYKSFFIDEFQDTSVMQWQNILPLINNAMSAGGYCMIVGDAKQSIYRWRGGEAEQFISLFEDLDVSNKTSINGKIVELYPRQQLSLENNWRSRSEIVDFNNRFYESCAKMLGSSSYQNLYKNAPQIPKGKAEGYVELTVLDKDTAVYNKENLDQVIQKIKNAQENGYHLGDISILVRNKRNGQAILEHLAQMSIACYSADSLMVGKAKEVKLILAILHWHLLQNNKELRLNLLIQLLLNNVVEVPKKEWHNYLKTHLNLSVKEFWAYVQTHLPHLAETLQEEYFLYDLCERLFYVTKVFKTSNSFIAAFLDKVHEFSQRKDPLVSGFLDWWQQHGEKLAVDPPAGGNAVAVMTIHKSKGLEFPVVIIPFCDWKIDEEMKPKIWYQLEHESELPFSLISLKKEVAPLIGGQYLEQYNDYKTKVRFDNLNVLYVATTRACNNLHIFTRPHKSGRTFNFFEHFLAEEGKDANTQGVYVWGKYTAIEEKELPQKAPAPRIISNSWEGKVEIATSYPHNWPSNQKDPAYWGSLVHKLLSQIYAYADVEPVLSQALTGGVILEEDLLPVRKLIESLMAHPELKAFYGKDAYAINEREILVPGFENKRPDRLVKLDDRWVVIDYKTGAEENKHFKQLNEYGQLIQESFGLPTEKVLVYLNGKVEVKSWTKEFS